MWVLVAGFMALSILGMLHHEPWRDEAQAWFIARDCPDIASVIRITGYEGHPALWHLILMPLARTGLGFVSASLVHFLIILTAVVLFLRNAPFALHQKALFVFGYYVLYEYNILVRNYALSVLLLFAIASLYRQRFQKPIAYASLISLLANANLFGLMIAFILLAAYWVEFRRSRNPADGRRCVIALLLVATCFAVSIYQLWPPVDVLPPKAHNGQIKDSLFDLRFSIGHLSVIPRALVGAFLPVPQTGPHFWNSRLAHYPLQAAGFFESLPWFIRWAYGTLVVCPALLSLAFLARKTVPFLFYLFSCCSLLSVFLLLYEGGARHYGFIFMLFVFTLWISDEYADNRLARYPFVIKWLSPRNFNWLLTGFFVIQTAASAAAFYNELKYDFSSGKNAAAFLKGEGLLNDRVFIATYPSKTACSILLHIETPHPAAYMIEYQRPGSFMVWNREYMFNQTLPAATVMERIDRAIAGQNYERVILITNSTIAVEGFHERYRLIASFDETVERQESFCIYELQKPLPDTTSGRSNLP
jgi:hypothetical protein